MQNHKNFDQSALFLCGQIVKEYNDEAESATGYYDDYQRIYVVTPLSHRQYNTILHHIKNAIFNKNAKIFEQVKILKSDIVISVMS